MVGDGWGRDVTRAGAERCGLKQHGPARLRAGVGLAWRVVQVWSGSDRIVTRSDEVRLGMSVGRGRRG